MAVFTIAIAGSGVLTGLLGATVVGQAYMQKQQADAQAAEIERQAEQERVAAEGEELQRRQRLNKAMAANVVSQSMSGIAGEGTPESIAMESAKQISLSEGMENLSDRLRRSQLQRMAKNTKRAGTLAAGSTLLKGGIQAASMGMSGGGDTGGLA